MADLAMGGISGDADVAVVAQLFADRTRSRILMALADGRALPASLLASEAGVSAQATSTQLGRLLEAGFIAVEPSGRHRYYRICDDRVGDVLEALALLAPAQPVRSLREGTQAQALRAGRTCFDHLAGRIGVELTAALERGGAIATTDGVSGTGRREGDPLSAQLASAPYALGPHAKRMFGELGVDLETLTDERARRPLIRACMDWTEQRHHLAGRLASALREALVERGWIAQRRGNRAVIVTDRGERELARVLHGYRQGYARVAERDHQ